MLILRIQDMALTAGASGKPGFIGAVIGAAASFAATKIAQEGADDRAQEGREFTERQLKHRHQWEVDDLKKAGLNPVLSATKGAPSIGSSPVATTLNPADNIGQAVQSALAVEKLGAEINLLKSQATKNRADARGTDNISDITENVANVNKGLHGATENIGNAAKTVTDTATKNLRDTVKVGKDMKDGSFWRRHPFWSKFMKNRKRKRRLWKKK